MDLSMHVRPEFHRLREDFCSMADSWRCGPTNVRDLGLGLNRKLDLKAQARPEHGHQNKSDDFCLSWRERVRMDVAQDVAVLAGGQAPSRWELVALSQGGIEAKLTPASIVQRCARENGCVHFKQ